MQKQVSARKAAGFPRSPLKAQELLLKRSLYSPKQTQKGRWGHRPLRIR